MVYGLSQRSLETLRRVLEMEIECCEIEGKHGDHVQDLRVALAEIAIPEVQDGWLMHTVH